MLNDATCFKAVYIVCGCTDLRAGMDRLSALVETRTGNRPYIPDTLYLFCGRRTDRIKGLVWEGAAALFPFLKRASKTTGYSGCSHYFKHRHYDGRPATPDSQNLLSSAIMEPVKIQGAASWLWNIQKKN